MSKVAEDAMKTVGIADLGSNTARLVVFEFERGQWFQMVDSVREAVRLGEGLARDGRLAPAAVSRALAAVELFEDYAQAVGLDSLEILATSAVRDASNRDEVLAPIRREGYSVRVLPGEEEAELGVLAVANAFAVDDAFVMDLGGGSAQVSRMAARRYVGGRAYPLGAVRLTEKWLHDDPPAGREIAALERNVAAELTRAAARIRESGLPLIAMGGTVRTLAKIDQAMRAYPLPILHGYRLSRERLEAVVEKLRRASLDERRTIDGLRPDRADIIVAGGLVYRWLLRAAELDEVIISGHGVREGALYRHLLPAPYCVDDVRSFSVRNLARRHSQPAVHIHQVAKLAEQIFLALQPLHALGDSERELLAAAAELHDVGVTLDYYRHHKHGQYILTSSALPGFDHQELAMLALLIRYHRRGVPRARGYKGLLSAEHERALICLTACLRAAESLERSRAGRVRDLVIDYDDHQIRFELQSEEEPAVELWEVRKHAELFANAFGGRRLTASFKLITRP